MQFVRKIFLVVSNPEQVPNYARKIGNLEVVLHRDIIPDKFLPTFNCMTIEMFLHRIPGLSEHFIYFNDDMIILRKQKPDRWFDMETGIPNNGFKFSKYKYPMPAYIYAFLNSLKVAAVAANHHDYPTCDGKYFTLQHTTKAMLKSTCHELSNKIQDKIDASCTTFRDKNNLNIYMFQFYDLFTGRCNNVTRKSFKHVVNGKGLLLDFYYNDEICVNFTDESEKRTYLERMARTLKCDKPPRCP